MCEHAVVRTPSVQNRSLTASGMPSSGPALPAWMRASDAFAMARARSGVSSTNALSARAFSIARTCASANSTAEKSFFFSPSRAAANVSEVSSLMSGAVACKNIRSSAWRHLLDHDATVSLLFADQLARLRQPHGAQILRGVAVGHLSGGNDFHQPPVALDLVLVAGQTPVSYTHLRADETVLDIV